MISVGGHGCSRHCPLCRWNVRPPDPFADRGCVVLPKGACTERSCEKIGTVAAVYDRRILESTISALIERRYSTVGRFFHSFKAMYTPPAKLRSTTAVLEDQGWVFQQSVKCARVSCAWPSEASFLRRCRTTPPVLGREIQQPRRVFRP